MKQFLNRYWFLVLLAFGATFLILVKKFFQTNPFPVVASLNPPSGEIEKPLEIITIKFQSQGGFLASDFNLISVPSFQFELEVKEGSLLAIPKSEFILDEKYIFELRYKNQTLYSWSYTLVSPPPSALEKEASYGKGNPNAVGEIEKQTFKEFPLLKQTPRETENYLLDYMDPLVLGIKVKKGSKEEVEREVRLWLNEVGVGEDSHELFWIE